MSDDCRRPDKLVRVSIRGERSSGVAPRNASELSRCAFAHRQVRVPANPPGQQRTGYQATERPQFASNGRTVRSESFAVQFRGAASSEGLRPARARRPRPPATSAVRHRRAQVGAHWWGVGCRSRWILLVLASAPKGRHRPLFSPQSPRVGRCGQRVPMKRDRKAPGLPVAPRQPHPAPPRGRRPRYTTSGDSIVPVRRQRSAGHTSGVR